MAGSRHEYRTWGKLAEDDITRLPKEYEARVSEDNRVYFVNHSTEQTSWENPINGWRYKVTNGLPYGWQKFRDSNDTLVYVEYVR